MDHHRKHKTRRLDYTEKLYEQTIPETLIVRGHGNIGCGLSQSKPLLIILLDNRGTHHSQKY